MKRLAILIALLLASPLYAANEVVFNYGTTGLTLYFVDFNASGQAWDTTGTPAYETFTTARGDYDIALTEVTGTGLYRGSLPAAEGQHYWSIYLQAGGSPSATDDVLIGAGAGYFDGSNLGDAAIVDAAGGGTVLPVNQTPVPKYRTWTLVATNNGLEGAKIGVKAGSGDKLFAIDFMNDLPNNGRVIDINSVELVSGTAGGVTFGLTLSDSDDYGVDRSQAKVRMTPVTAGTYVIRVSVDYDDSDGGGTQEGDVTLVVGE